MATTTVREKAEEQQGNLDLWQKFDMNMFWLPQHSMTSPKRPPNYHRLPGGFTFCFDFLWGGTSDETSGRRTKVM